MTDFAEQYFDLFGRSGKNKSSKFDTFKQVAKTKDCDVEEILEQNGYTVPDVPWSGFDAWQAWSFLSNFRGSSGFGANPVSSHDCWQYCEMRGVAMRYRYWFCLDIARIDSAFRKWANESHNDRPVRTKTKH